MNKIQRNIYFLIRLQKGSRQNFQGVAIIEFVWFLSHTFYYLRFEMCYFDLIIVPVLTLNPQRLFME